MGRPKLIQEEEQVDKLERIVITAPRFDTMIVPLIGSAPLVVHRFSEKAMKEILGKQKDPTSRSKTPRIAKNVDELYKACLYVSDEGWFGFPSSAFRSAAIRACSLVGYHMTRAKMSIFIVPDGFDKYDGTPLTKIIHKEPEMHIGPVRIQGTSDVRIRAMFREGWKTNLKLRWDGDQFQKSDVVNLINRVGVQVGVGEGRPSSPKSCGMGWGTFEIETAE